jgi:predicted RecA/RadA family phage recombinase
MPPAIVPPTSRVAQKWARRAGNAGEEYAEGVRTTPKSWATAAKAAENNYKTGVTQAATAGRYGKGVDRVGDAKWKKNAAEKGPARFSQGVAVAEQDYSAQVGPYLEAIGRTDLPPRGPAGSEANYNRVSAIGKALRQLSQSR